jgi:ADP-heptose:LPS heptosyltransferase
MKDKKKHILVIRLSAMGDVAMLVPVIQALFQQNDNVKVTVLSRAFLKPIFDKEISGLDVQFVIVNTKGKHKGILGIYKLFKELKSLQINAIADTHNVLRSKILSLFFKLSGKKVIAIDKGRKEKKKLITSRDKKQLKTTHQRYADVFAKLGFKIDLRKHTFCEKPNLPNGFTLNKTNGKQIGIAPFAQYQGKMYPLDLMGKVIEKLSVNNSIYLFGGGKNEIDLLNKISSKFPNTQNLAGKLSLKEELQVISNLDIMLAMDSGNAHFAAMFNVKTITVWGVTHPFAGFAPFKQQQNCLLPDLKKYPKIPCSIYGNKICNGYENVMRSIPPEVIVKRILD